MGKVDYKNELNHYEEESSDQPEIHPGFAERAFGYEKRTDNTADYDQIFQSPKSVNNYER